MRIPTIRLALVFCGLGAALPTTAADIRTQLPPDLIYNHCQAAGAGSETEGTFMLPNGRVTGTILCTEADLVAPKTTASEQHGEKHDDLHHDGDNDGDREDDDGDD